MKLIDRLERRFGRYAIPNLPLLIVMGQGVVLLLSWSAAISPRGWPDQRMGAAGQGGPWLVSGGGW